MCDVTAASLTNMTQQATASDISMRVAKKSLDAAKAQGDAAVALIQSVAKVQKQERSYTASPGGSLDVTA
jgi:hypothetical protein